MSAQAVALDSSRTSLDSAPSRRPIGTVTVCFFYLGLAASLPTYLDISTSLISSALAVALLVAWVGWRNQKAWRGLTQYLGVVAVAIALAALSSISAWDTGSMYRTVTFAAWVGFVIPGAANLLRERQNRRAVMVGIAIGTAVYGIAAFVRWASGQEILDVAVTGDVEKKILGVGRNGVNMRAVVVLPFLLWWVRARPSALYRWFMVVAVLFWLLISGGRAGLIAGGFALLLFAVLQPGLGRKTRSLLVVAVLAISVVTMFRDSASPIGEGIDRIATYLHGERTQSDEARELLVRKGWAIAEEHPVVGIGFGNFVGVDHPVLREASSSRVREIARSGVAHNTYAEILAELGFLGGSGVFALFALVLVSGVRRARRLEVRLATASLGGMLLAIYFDTALAGLLFFTLALVLGAQAEHQSSFDPVEPHSEVVRS